MLPELWDLAASCGGWFYCDPDGLFNYANATRWLNEDAPAYFLDPGKWGGYSKSYNDGNLVKTVVVELSPMNELTEAVLKKVSQGDEDWSTLDAVSDGDLEKELEGMSLDDFLLEARSFSGNLELEASKVNGLVQIPIGDFGTDGFDQDLYVLHYPAEKAVVALLVKF